MNATITDKFNNVLQEFVHLNTMLEKTKSEEQLAEFSNNFDMYIYDAIADPLGIDLVRILELKREMWEFAVDAPAEGHLPPIDWMSSLENNGSLMSLYISALNNPALGNVKVTECEGLSILYDGLERSLESVRKLRNKVLQKIDLKDDEYLVRGPIILESVDVNQKAIREAEEILEKR